jgi:hypothetical protein
VNGDAASNPADRRTRPRGVDLLAEHEQNACIINRNRRGNETMKRLAIVLGLLIIASTTAAAADSSGFGLGIGMVKVKDADKSNLWLTCNLRTMLGGYVALEPEVGWYHDSLGDVHAFNGGGSLLIVVPTRQVDVFAGAGLGAHMFRYSGGVGNTTKLGYHGLAGVDLLASSTVSLFGAVRYEIINSNTDVKTKQWKLYGGLRFRSR